VPTYAYRCKECRAEFEVVQKISEPPLTTCSRCGQDAATRQIQASTFVLKGGGWYADGYGRRSSKGAD
jgi:putative FmdB family regulatory protein